MTRPATEPKTTLEGSTSSPSSPTPEPATPRGVTAPGLTVGQWTPSPTTESDAAHSIGSEPGGPADPLDRTDTPSASSAAPAGSLKVGKRELRDVFRGLVLGASVAVHQALARTPIERENKVWLMESETEAAGVADPLASIAGRRAGATEVTSDVGDLIAAGVAIAGYVLSNVMKAVQLRRAVKAMSEHNPSFIPNPETENTP